MRLIVERTQPHGPDRQIGHPRGDQDDDPARRALGPQGPHHVQAFILERLEIDEGDVQPPPIRQPLSRVEAVGVEDVTSPLPEPAPETAASAVVAVNKQDRVA